MSDIKGLKMDIASSLWIKPASLKELKDRDFLKRMSLGEIDRLLFWMENNGWIFEKKGKFHCYKKTVTNILNPAGYELVVKTDTRTEFEKEFAPINR